MGRGIGRRIKGAVSSAGARMNNWQEGATIGALLNMTPQGRALSLGGVLAGAAKGALAGKLGGDQLKTAWYGFSGRAARDAEEVAAAEARASAEARQRYIDGMVRKVRADFGVGPEDADIQKVAAGGDAAATLAMVSLRDKAKATKEAIALDDNEYEGSFRDEAVRQSREGYGAGLLNIRRRLAGQGMLGGTLDSGLHRRLMEGFVGERQRAVASAKAQRQQLEEGRFNTRMDLEKRAQAGDLVNTRFDDLQRQTQTGINQARAKNMPQAFGEVLATFGKGVESYTDASDRATRRSAGDTLPDDDGRTEFV